VGSRLNFLMVSPSKCVLVVALELLNYQLLECLGCKILLIHKMLPIGKLLHRWGRLARCPVLVHNSLLLLLVIVLLKLNSLVSNVLLLK